MMVALGFSRPTQDAGAKSIMRTAGQEKPGAAAGVCSMDGVGGGVKVGGDGVVGDVVTSCWEGRNGVQNLRKIKW